MKLYDCAGAVNPRRIRIFLAEKGIDVMRAEVDIFKGQQHEGWFTKLNPMRSVPCLELDDAAVIAETAAIARYFEAQNPEPAMLGKTPEEQAHTEMWTRRMEHGLLDAAVTYFHHATDGLGEAERYRNRDWGEFNKKQAGETLAWLDTELANRRYIAGDDYSFADITALCGVDFAKMVGIEAPANLTHLKRWHEEASARPSASA